MPTRLKTLLKKFVLMMAYYPRTWRLVWQATRGWTLAMLTLLFLQGLLPASTAYCTKLIVEGFVARAPFEQLAIYALAFGSALLISEILRSATSIVRTHQVELLQGHLIGLIQRQSVAVDYAFYELPDYYDHLHRARGEAGYRPQQLLETVGSLLQDGVTLVALLFVLLPYGWWLPLVLLLATLPSLVVVLRATLQRYEWRRATTGDERRASYYDWVLTASETAAEVRLFALGEYFQQAYVEVRGTLRRKRLKLARSEAFASLLASLLALFLTGAALGWMGWRAWQGAISLGVLALFYQAFNQGQLALRALLGHVGALYENGLFLGDLFAFLDLKPQIIASDNAKQLPVKVQNAIRFEHVSFAYPSSTEGHERIALRDFDLTIQAGEFIAIVGLNGAGKTTLLKLLCRLYDPTVGRISLDGVDLREFDPVALRQMITVLFQSPVDYQMSVAENIGLGSANAEVERGGIERAAQAAAVDEIAKKLPAGLDTLLGKWFAGGTELSVGEWQRVALARAFLRQAPIVLLDEPTSAMDAWNEMAWLRRLRELLAGRIALLITHRFTTAMHADQIYVMDAGQVIETGTHLELLALGGRYAQSWHEQTQRAN